MTASEGCTSSFDALLGQLQRKLLCDYHTYFNFWRFFCNENNLEKNENFDFFNFEYKLSMFQVLTTLLCPLEQETGAPLGNEQPCDGKIDARNGPIKVG
jgi:hypothetical protein